MRDYPHGRVGIFGYGLIGKSRYNAVCDSITRNDIYIFDPKLNKDPLTTDFNLIKSENELIELNLENYFICVPHSDAVSIVQRLKKTKSNILLEKPLGRSLEEAIVLHSESNPSQLRIGFNYRFMRGVQELKNIIANGELGDILSIEMEIGHGGSPGDEQTWKLDPVIAGGGALLDPGVHLIDLLNFIFSISSQNIEIHGVVKTGGFWNTGIEEVAKVVASSKGINISLGISLVSWKTRFLIRVTGKEGYVELTGRGRSDGPQILAMGKRWGWISGVSQLDSEQSEVVMQIDDSLKLETSAFLSKSQGVATSSEGLDVMKTYDKILKYSEL